MNVVITGASRGIGLELTREALAKGDHVLAIARRPAQSKGLAELGQKYSGQLRLLAADMKDPECVAKILDGCEGWAHVDLVINNAGIYPKGDSVADFAEGFQVNSISPYIISKSLLPKLQKAKDPKIVQLTSLMGSIADNSSGGACAYRASKTALNMMNKCLAVENAWLATIVIHPGWVKTEMGGSSAPVEAVQSAQGIWKVIRALSIADSGKFFNYRGENLPW